MNNFHEFKQGNRFIYGTHAVKEALENAKVKLILTAGNSNPNLIKKAEKMRIPIEKKLVSELDIFSEGANHQGIAAITEGYEYMKWENLLNLIKTEKEPLLIFLDRIMDPANLGAIIRSAYLFGATAVIIPFKKSASVTSGTVKSSVGATEYIPVCRVINMGKSLEELGNLGFKTVAAVMDSEQKPLETDFSGPVALVTGSEAKGIRPSVLKQCNLKVTIPMKGKHLGSFNASVATALLLYSIQVSRKII